jgi:hypothetical protein
VKLLARLLLVAALLFAQTAGVAHEIWHSTADLAADGGTPQKGPLCDFHTTLGSVSTGLCSAQYFPEVCLGEISSFTGAESRAPRFSLLAAHSRGPPALL